MVRGHYLQLCELVKDWPCLIKGNIRTEVLSISENSKVVGEQIIFCAKQGQQYNGMQFVSEAISNGAVCIVVDNEQFYESFQLEIPIVWVPNLRRFIAYAAAALNQFPTEAIQVVAVTGTNGKTSTTSFVYQLLSHLQKKVVLVGTNGLFYNGAPLNTKYSNLTTISAIEFQSLAKEAVKNQYDAVIIEASSQGLAEHRLDYSTIDIGVFLNLSEDHIEWHGSKEKYKNAKLRLADLSKVLIVNNDDSFCKAVGLMTKKEVTTFSKQPTAQLFYEKLNLENSNTYCLQYKEEKAVCTFPFAPYFLIENAVAAIAICIKCGYSLQELSSIVPLLTLPEGRVETFKDEKGTTIIVDYAHTANALQALLSSLNMDREFLKIVFSCGGNRDQMKRKKMGEIASAYCGEIYLTTDNCRSENPIRINEQIAEGFCEDQKYEIILDRKTAIQKAILDSSQTHSVVIAGKGHETTQTIGNEVIPYSDIEVVKEIISTKAKNEKSL